jgi:hypothetical protein
MKNNPYFLISRFFLLLIALIVNTFWSNAQTVVSIQPDRAKALGDTVQVPIRLTGENILNMAFYVTYDHTILTPFETPYINVHPAMAVTGFNPSWNSTTMGLYIDAIGLSGINFNGEVVLTLVFTIVTYGTTQLEFRTSPLPSPVSRIWDELGNRITPVSYFGNKISTSTLVVQGVTIGSGQSNCYDATQTIYVAGSGTTFIVQNGGSATMIAGQNILYYPGTMVYSGGYMQGYIAPNGPWCGIMAPSIVKVVTGEEEVPFLSAQPIFKVYPNPTTGNFTLEQMDEKVCGNVKVEVYGILGNHVLTVERIWEKKHGFSLSEVPVGVYFIRVFAGDKSETIKIIKH